VIYDVYGFTRFRIFGFARVRKLGPACGPLRGSVPPAEPCSKLERKRNIP